MLNSGLTPHDATRTDGGGSCAALPLRITRRQIGVAAAIALLTIFLGWLRTTPGVIGVYHDDGIYVATAKALATGRGYTLDFLPEPLPETKYPIGVPVLFALVWKLFPRFPENAILFHVLPLVAFSLANALGSLFLIRHRYAGARAAFAGGAILALSPAVLYYVTLPLSEGFFCLFTVLAFWAIETTMVARQRIGRRAALAGILVALAALSRSIGAIWIGVAALYFLARRRRAVVPFLACAVPPCLAWIAWSMTARPAVVPELLRYYVDYSVDWQNVHGWGYFRIACQNGIWIMAYLGANLFPGAWVVLLLTGVPLAFPIWTPFLLLLPGAVSTARQGRALPWALAAYFIPVLVHPWPPERFWIPLMPLAAGLSVSGAARLTQKWWPRRRRIVVELACFPILLNLIYFGMILQSIRQTGYPVMIPDDKVPRWSSFQEGFAWIRNNTPRDAIVAAALDPTVWLYTGRRAFRFYNPKPIDAWYNGKKENIYDADELLANMRKEGASFLLDTPLYNFAVDRDVRDKIALLARRQPSPIHRLFQSRDGSIRVYRIREEERTSVSRCSPGLKQAKLPESAHTDARDLLGAGVSP